MALKFDELERLDEFEIEADVYVRVSSEDQQERETIENQIEFATKYCDLHKIRIREWYKDDGITGTIALEQRPDGKRLIDDMKNGRSAKLVLIYNMKRLGRKARVTLDAIDQFEKYGVMVRSMTEPFDTGTPVGRFIITVLAGQAELDRDTTLEVMWHGANRAARKGKWLGGIVPYGYRVNEERFLEINEDPIPGSEQFSEASVIRLIYNLIARQKYTTIEVADYLNAFKIPPSYVKDGRKVKKGKRKVNTAGIWTPGRVGSIIKSTTYKGVHIYGKRSEKDRELIPRAVPAIVSEEEWNLAQEVIKSNQIEAMKNSKRQYLLRGLIRCGCCGLTYHGTAYNGANRSSQSYYVCGGKTSYRGPYQGKCISKNVPADYIENLVWSECVNFLNNPEQTLKEILSETKSPDDIKTSLIEEKRLAVKAVAEKENEKKAILDLYRKKLIEPSDVELQLQTIAQEKSLLEKRIAELDQIIDTHIEFKNKLEEAQTHLLELRKKLKGDISFQDKREIVLYLVREVIIDTIFPDDGSRSSSRKRARIKAKYAFGNIKDVIGTPVRAVNNLDFVIERKSNLPYMTYAHADNDSPGSRIRLARTLLHLSIKELSNRTGLSETAIIQIESNNSKPSFPTLRMFSEALNTPIYYLGCFESMPERTIGEKIRKARFYRGLTKIEAALHFGADVKSITNWETDKHTPSFDFMDKVKHFIDILNQ